MDTLLDQSLGVFGRTLLIYLVAVVLVKLMGKREVGQLSPLDFVIAVIIGSVAAAPMVSITIPLIPAVVALLTLGALEIAASILSLHSYPFRRFFEDKPIIIIRNGRILKENMSKIRMNMDDLKQELRLLGVVDINEVEEGTMESNGEFSLIKKKAHQPPTAKDLHLLTPDNPAMVFESFSRKARLELEELLNRRR